MPPRKPLTVVKLSDHGGQFMLVLKCEHCGHVREANPETFARIVGWEALLHVDPGTIAMLPMQRTAMHRDGTQSNEA